MFKCVWIIFMWDLFVLQCWLSCRERSIERVVGGERLPYSFSWQAVTHCKEGMYIKGVKSYFYQQ